MNLLGELLILFLFRNVLKDFKQMIPYHLNSRDVQTLIGRMDETERRAEAHHVDMRITL